MFHRRIITFLFLCVPVSAADQWIKISTPHFELFTTAGEKKGREAILYFEQVRSFFLLASPAKTAPEFPVRIVAFRGEKQYQPYRINEFAFAYYVQGRNNDYIVMQDIVSEHYPVAIHEYMHLVIRHSGLHMPVWLNEGWADLFSTLKPQGKKAVVGDLLPGRSQTLVTNKLIAFDVLTAVDHNSPLYNEKNKASMFYAESWALTHMLFFSPDYRPNFVKFVATLTGGKSMDESCQAAFGKHLWDVETDFRNYIRGDRFYHMIVDIKLEKSDEEPEVSDASPFESEMMLADLLVINKKVDAARGALEQLAKTNPEKPEIEESLGYLDWQAKDEAGARRHFALAVSKGTKNAQMCFQYAMMERRAGTPAKEIIPALQKAVQLKPDYVDAQLQLGEMLVREGSYLQAIGQLRAIRKVPPEQASYLFGALAYSYMRTGDMSKAQENAEYAKKWAKTPEQQKQADSMLHYLESSKTRPTVAQSRDERPVLKYADPREFKVTEQTPIVNPANPFITKEDKMNHVEGTAQKLVCGGDSLLFHVQVDKTIMIFEIPDADRVVIKHSGELKHDFACGAQKGYKVTVDYALLPDPKTGSAGIVRGLEF
jgi:tetratricopeptide (TPR) repeat protein